MGGFQVQVFIDTHAGWFHNAGLIGVAIYVTLYFALTFEMISSKAFTYYALNFLAAAMVLLGLLVAFNLASALIQIFWVVISTGGMILRLRERVPQNSSGR
ncbi:hypothetical protein [Cognatishimia sp. MH4019]|uniref:CBU_0592 family membrane protein n=1 Tax=Cognatishimia sp. MH4019 TaxID=2854030 RepID=UPI001CD5D2F0|nr:hypothetical protein [Cognatishimia sp. MH4019]